jgi:hypothetical protein
VDKDKYVLGLGQEKMAVPPPDEDVVTMGPSAALPIVRADGADNLGLLIFATETGVDQSKAAAILSTACWSCPRPAPVEMKEACYAATAGLHLCLRMDGRPSGSHGAGHRGGHRPLRPAQSRRTDTGRRRGRDAPSRRIRACWRSTRNPACTPRT